MLFGELGCVSVTLKMVGKWTLYALFLEDHRLYRKGRFLGFNLFYIFFRLSL